MRRFSKALCGGLLLSLLSVPAAAQDEQGDGATPPLPMIGLMGTIPIFWGEAAGFDELIAGEAAPHWAREVLDRRATLAPLDYLSAEALAAHRFLLMAQPRGLSGEENVALDAWVREGGRLLLFADPWMTGESRFHIGDRRRPQDVALLSPILARWGLELQADDNADSNHDHSDTELVAYGEQMLPINMAGRFALMAGGDSCELQAGGLLAQCSIGDGAVLIMADAAILDLAGPYPHAETGIESLISQIFPEIGEIAGNRAVLLQARSGSDGNPPDFESFDDQDHHIIGGNSP